VFFIFPANARWNADLEAVEFGVGIGEYGASSAFRGKCSNACSATRRRHGLGAHLN
jgi:hypothetical protein